MQWLSILVALPVIGAAIAGFIPGSSEKLIKQIGTAVALLTGVIALAMAFAFDPSAEGMQFVEKYSWIPAFGINFQLGVDGISLTLIVLGSFARSGRDDCRLERICRSSRNRQAVRHPHASHRSNDGRRLRCD